MTNTDNYSPQQKARANRALELTVFLHKHGWDEAELTGLDADFSSRRYARLSKPDGTSSIFMDAYDAQKNDNQKTHEFVALASLLRRHNLRAPEIYAAHVDKGMVLMEDLAGSTFGALVDKGMPAAAYYQRGVDALITLHNSINPAHITLPDGDPFPALPRFDAALFATQAMLYMDEYLPFMGVDGRDPDVRAELHALWVALLAPTSQLPQSLLLRDCTLDNLILCKDGTTGLLDFQDAGIGPIAYDLMSLCEMVRRGNTQDGGWAQLPLLIDYYMNAAKPTCTRDDLMHACTILSAQRHMRILGIVAKQIRIGKTDKSNLLPRINAHLAHLVKDDALTPLRDWLAAHNLSLTRFA